MRVNILTASFVPQEVSPTPTLNSVPVWIDEEGVGTRSRDASNAALVGRGGHRTLGVATHSISFCQIGI